jgi:hypothetical protein
MRKVLFTILRKIHYSIPLPIRNLYMYFVKLVRKFRYYFLPLYIYTGNEKKTGSEIRIAFMALDNTVFYYWMNRFLEKNFRVSKKMIIPAWKWNRYFNINKENYDLAIIEINNITRKYVRPGKGFLLPRWLEMQLDTEEFMKKIKKKDIRRRIRKYSFSFEQKSSDEDFKFYHERMYTPYLIKRYKDSAVICDYNFFISIFKRKDTRMGFLLKDGDPVAGSITEVKNNKLRMSSNGILDGREDIMKMGVMGAIYYFEVLNCINKGIKSVSIGGTSPILSDGLTRYKLSMGGKAEDISRLYSQYLWLNPLKDSPALRSILKLNPFIHRINNDLYSSIFIDPQEYENKDEFLRYYHLINCRNIKSARIYCYRNTGKIAGWIKEEGYQNVQILNFDFK